MKKLTLLLFALGTICTVKAQKTAENYDSNAEMQTQMQLIVNTLKLDNHEIHQLGQIMEAKRKEKEVILAEIDALKQKLASIELEKEKELRGILTDDQWAKYQAEVASKTKKVADDHMKTIDK